MNDEIRKIALSVTSGGVAPIIGIRNLFRHKQAFGDIDNDDVKTIVGVYSQTDHLIFSEGKLVNREAISSEDLTYFNNLIIEFCTNITTAE